MALKTSIIHCLLDAEPDGFHPVDPSVKTLAVNLGFECLTDILRHEIIGEDDPAKVKRTELSADEKFARERFTTFAAAAQQVRFHLFEANLEIPATCSLTYKGEITRQISDAKAPNAALDVTIWLDKAAPKSPDIRHYWTTPDVSAVPDTPVEATTAPATYRLRAAHSWNAPVAHRLWLTHILQPEGIADGARYVVLPLFTTDPFPAVVTAPHDDLWDFTYDAGGGLGEITCRTEVLEAPDNFAVDPEEVSGFLTPEGYLKVDAQAEELWRVTKWFEARAASLLAPATALAGPGAGAGSDDDKRYDTLFQWSYGTATAPLLNAPAAAWLAAASLGAALDNLIIGVMKPVSTANTVGDILAPLVLGLRAHFQENLADTFTLPEDSYDLGGLTGVLRSTLSIHNPLLRSTSDMADAGVRAAFCESLKQVHGIASTGAETAPEIQLLNLLLASFASGTALPFDAKLWPTFNGNGPLMLRRVLAEAEQRLQDETGAETAIARLFETTRKTEDGGKTFTTFPELFARAYAETVGQTGDAALISAVAAAFSDAWRSYRLLLDGAFNGAEAVRRDAASEFTKALLRFADQHRRPAMPSVQRLIGVAFGADYFGERILRLESPPDPHEPIPLTACFRGIVDSLVRVPFPTNWPDGVTSVAPTQLLPFFQNAYRAALAPMARLTIRSARFIPDNAPAPLPIQIAANIDGEAIDEFAKNFNGVAVAIRRIDTADRSDPWAHTSLAELTWPAPPPLKSGETPPAPTVAAAIHPMLPGSSDGRGPMFIEYEGLPLAATAFRDTAADAIMAPIEAFAPFYVYGAPDLEASAFAAIPRLAYGREFETFSFATTNAGSIPLALQASLPWMPKADFEAPAMDGKPDPLLVTTTPYQRRTAIGQMAVNEKPLINEPRRIAVPIDGVAPLAEDYPRTTIAAFTGSPGVRDLFRDRDGGGTLTVPALVSRPIEWQVSGVVFNGKPRRLVARLFNKAPAGPDDKGIAETSLDFPDGFDFSTIDAIVFRAESVRVGTPTQERHFSFVCGNASTPAIVTTISEIAAGWIRLSLEADDAASLSFAVTDDVKPHEVSAPLLVLAPDEAPWKHALRGSVTVEVDTPRIGYLDFERWFANADLRNAAFDADTAQSLQRALLTAYVLRDADEGLSRALDRLPDPAFEAVRLELAVSDQLDDSAHSAIAHILPFGFKPTMQAIMKKLSDHGKAQWSPADLRAKLFDPMEKAFRFSIEIKPGTFALLQSKTQVGNPPAIAASIPAGVVARLSLDALVPERHFETSTKHPPVFNAGLKQHAPRKIVPEGSTEAFFAYPSAAVRVETMLDGMNAIDSARDKEADKPAIKLAADMVAVRPIERSRRYDLQTRATLPSADQAKRTRQWRLLSEIDVTTQRWRPSGRPIYNHIAPMHFRDEEALADKLPPDATYPALPLKEMPIKEDGKDKDYPLARFEQEAFFDRPNIDSQTVTQRLLPLPARTVLEQHFWDAPSATYFRHRFTLRSRYAGAMKDITRREVKAWITNRNIRKSPADAWTLRVAMLADLSRMLLTRPQQRALIPLTSAPRDDGKTPGAPPVLAILQEPPFSRGGLADRIAAEIKTGFGYGFARDSDDPVEILDSRKEIGPDPRLSYHALDAQVALGMALNAEGPMGLTFDAVNAPAPAFPNSMFSLSPFSLSGANENLEEHFLGISMRRYIDPNWAIEKRADKPSHLDAERCWWIDSDTALTPGNLLAYVADGIEAPLLTLKIDGGALVIKTMKAAVDGGMAGAIDNDVVIARWNATFADRLTILHQPLAPGRYSASVFVLPAANQGNVALGQGNAPLLLCNFEWGPPKKAVQTGAATITLKAGDGARARATMASAPTFLAWTRIGRNFDTIYAPDFNDASPVLLEVSTRDLLANLDEKSSALTFDRSGVAERYWLCASTFLKPFPLHVQRHLAVLTTGYLKEPGRPVENYRRSALLVGKASARLSGRGDSEDCARIIEFETPASILCGSDVIVPETYRRAYFDLISTGFKTRDGAAAARLFFRFAGPPVHLKRFSKLAIGLRFSEKDADRHEITVDLTKAAAGQFVTAIEFFIERTATPGKLSYRPVLLCSNGETVDAPSVPATNDLGLLAADNHNPGFFLDIKAEGETGASEFWADVSLLHSPGPAFGSHFDFNWLFSQAGSSEPALNVTPAGLNAMVEAQARIISVSPPIPIKPQGG